MPSSVADNIRTELVRQQKYQSELTDLLGLTDSSISRRMRGETPWRHDELEKIAHLLGIGVGELFPAPLRLVEDTG